MDFIEWLKDRKRETEGNLKFAETAAGFRLFQVTADGGQVDLTEQHKKRLQAAIADYQRVIEDLESKIAGALPASNRPYDIK